MADINSGMSSMAGGGGELGGDGENQRNKA